MKKYTDLLVTAQQPIAKGRGRLCRHCTIYTLHQRLPLGALIKKKKRIQSICVTRCCFLTCSLSGKKVTLNPPCWCPFLQVLMGAQMCSWKAKACTAKHKTTKTKPQATTKLCLSDANIGIWLGPGDSFQSLWSSSCSDQRAG